jgi:hypothetical protein
MADGAAGRRHAGTRLRPRIRLALVSTCAGLLLTLLTTILCVSNAISTQQAIAMALPATVATLGGWISMTVPDAWIAWRRGFQHGCKVAMSCEATPLPPARPAAKPGPTGPDEPTVTELFARSGSRARSRTHRSDGF